MNVLLLFMLAIFVVHIFDHSKLLTILKRMEELGNERIEELKAKPN